MLVLSMGVALWGSGRSGYAQQQQSHMPDALGGSSLSEQARDRMDESLHAQLVVARRKAANVERQRLMANEAALLLQMAAALQLKLEKDEASSSREEMVQQVEAIERLAHNVKERMKGSR